MRQAENRERRQTAMHEIFQHGIVAVIMYVDARKTEQDENNGDAVDEAGVKKEFSLARKLCRENDEDIYD